MSHGKGRGLKAEERALWEKIAARTRPLDRRVPASPLRDEPKQKPVTPQPDRGGQDLRDGTRIPEDFRVGAKPTLKTAPRSTASPAPAMDAKTHGRMTRGKLKPEARIDLHGMTVAEAHPALTRFIEASHVRGRRLVLVITGKGREGMDTGPIPSRPGILRRQVPGWLMTGQLRAKVLDIAPAHQRHGGSGAYYVYLRRGG